MDNYSKIYWLTRLDNLQAFFQIVFTISATVLFLYHLIMALSIDEKEEYEQNWSKYRNLSFWVGLTALILMVFMPTKNDMILIYAGGKTMDYVQADSSLAKIPYQTTAIISNYLDKSIKEMEGKK